MKTIDIKRTIKNILKEKDQIAIIYFKNGLESEGIKIIQVSSNNDLIYNTYRTNNRNGGYIKSKYFGLLFKPNEVEKIELYKLL